MLRALALLVLAVLTAAGMLAVPTARSASPDLVVSQVFAGGGNCRRTLRERLRRALQPRLDRGRRQRLDGPVRVCRRHHVAGDRAAGSIAPGRHYLVQLASAAAVGAPLPAPDATGTTNLAVSGGKVAVVRDASPLTCGASAGSCSAVASVADLVGYGSAVDYEGSAPAAAIDNTTAATRGGDGCVDTDANSTRLRRRGPGAAQLVQRDDRLRRRTAPDRRRVAGRDGRRRHPARALHRARAIQRELRQRGDRHHAAARLRARDGRERQRRRVCADRAPHGLPARRPAARHRGHGPERRADRRLARRRRHGCHPDRACHRPARGNQGCAECRPRATSGTHASGSSRRFPPSPAGRYTATVTFTVVGR